MPAYVVAQVKISNPDAMGSYASQVTAVTESYGGRYLWAGPGVENLEGDWHPDGLAIIEFPSHADARRWYESAEYGPLIPLRQQAGPTSLIITPDTN